jgi:hypothetical protein
VAWDSISDGLVRAASRTFASSRTIIYDTAGASPTDVSGLCIFTEAHSETILDEDEASVQTVAPTLDVRLADLPTPPVEDMLVSINGVAHRIAGFEPDSEGGALLILEEVS